MNQLNSLILEGNVCKEPEIKEINGEKNLTTFSIAVNRILNAEEDSGFIEENVLVMGELELSGRIRAVKGIHAACSTAFASGIQYAVAGFMKPTEPLVRKTPFRIPHQTASIEGICGGGPNCRSGEISLAHNGVLFLDEAAEFRSSVLQMLRVPLESHTITLSRAGRSTTYPANFQLIMATNPCPCGNYGSKEKICLCSAKSVEMYWRKF